MRGTKGGVSCPGGGNEPVLGINRLYVNERFLAVLPGVQLLRLKIESVRSNYSTSGFSHFNRPKSPASTGRPGSASAREAAEPHHPARDGDGRRQCRRV